MLPFEQLEADVVYLGRRGDLEQALAQIEAIAANAEGDDRLRVELLRAQVFHCMGRAAEAIPIYQRVLAALPDDPRAQAIGCVELLAAANATGDFELGESVAQRAFALVRSHPDAAPAAASRVYVGYAQHMQLKGDFAAAIEWYRKALRCLEDSTDSAVSLVDRTAGVAWSWYGLARCYIATGNAIKARFAIDGIRCDPASRLALTLAALAEFRLHFRLRALDLAEQWLATAAEYGQDAELLQEVLLGQAQLASARGDQSTLRAALDRLEELPVPATYDIRKGVEALGLRQSS